MKQVEYKKTFQKQFKKLHPNQKEQFFQRLHSFLTDSNHSNLRIHALKWRYIWYKSMNISWDMRALFREEWDRLVIFYMIGTHSELY